MRSISNFIVHLKCGGRGGGGNRNWPAWPHLLPRNLEPERLNTCLIRWKVEGGGRGDDITHHFKQNIIILNRLRGGGIIEWQLMATVCLSNGSNCRLSRSLHIVYCLSLVYQLSLSSCLIYSSCLSNFCQSLSLWVYILTPSTEELYETKKIIHPFELYIRTARISYE